MEAKEIHISQGQNLSHIMPDGIPSNTILNKTICGIGATTLEILSQRHSIIVEPNVPVIKGKEKKHSTILGVYEGIKKNRIIDYINNCKGFCKIMTTPESFYRVKRALYETRLILRRDFFILFDECEKIVQDVDYRSRISLPMKDFFLAKNKAMVSATPLVPSDPRFEEQNFTIIKVIPDFDYKKKLSLLQTNNVYSLLDIVLRGIPEERKVCIFFNSTSGITKLIDRLNIGGESTIYCSQEATSRLKSHSYNAYDTLQMESGFVKLTKYTFLTSRFFSAVDIDLEEKPIVIILTELYSAPHSLIDPYTETIQILGRFRNGIQKGIHIINNREDIEVMSDDELAGFLKGEHKIYEALYLTKEQSTDTGELAILEQALQSVDYSRFVNSECQINHFMYDNAYNAEHTKALYKEYDAIYDAYISAGAFAVDWKKITLRFTDKQREYMSKSEISKESLNRYAFSIIRDLISRNNKYDKCQLEELSESVGTLIEAFDVLGTEKIMEVGFKDRDLKAAIASAKSFELENSIGVRQAVYTHFREFAWYSSREITSKLEEIYNTFNIKVDGRGISNKITLYFDARREDHSDKRGWKLERALHSVK